MTKVSDTATLVEAPSDQLRAPLPLGEMGFGASA